MQDNRIWKDNFRITSYDVDFKAKLVPSRLLQYFQEVAWRHAEFYDFGYTRLKERNQAWVLFKVVVHIQRMPVWDEDITIITWPKGIDKLFALRDFEVFDENDVKIISATSGWLVINFETRRPCRVDFLFERAQIVDKHAIVWNSKKLTGVPANCEIATRNVSNTDLDVNNHVNNARYLDWIIDSLPHSYLEKHSPVAIEVNFLNETRINDKLEICSCSSGKNSTSRSWHP